MPAAVVGGIIAGAGSLGAAAIQSHAAGKAADQQTAAGEKALALQRDIYNQQQANEAPWRNTGAAAIGTLGSLLGLPVGGGAGDTGQVPTLGGGPVQFSPAIQQARELRHDPTAPTMLGNPIAKAQQGNANYVDVTGSAYTPSDYMRADLPPTGGSFTGATVRVQAPNGQIYRVPSAQVQQAVQNGGTVING